MIANRSLRPIQSMITKAQRISVRNIDDRLPQSKTGDELDQLAETLNEMLDRIQRYVIQLRQFTADASHELRSPLAALRGSAEVALTRDRPAEELKQVIEESIQHFDRLGRMAEDLLLLAQADAGHPSLRLSEIQLDQAIADVIDLYEPLANDQGIELTFENREGIWMEADGPRLRQLIGNLVDNAIKYVGAGKTVAISASGQNGTAEIVVADNGPGISPDHLAKIFDRFYRVDRSRSGQGPGGAGLGLSICRTIAKAHGGRIKIASTSHEGTTVSIVLPLVANTGKP